MINTKQIRRLFGAVLKLNGLQERKQENTGNLPTAFFDFSGHVVKVNVRIYPNGWEADSNPESFDIYIDSDFGDTFEDCMNYINKVKLVTAKDQHERKA